MMWALAPFQSLLDELDEGNAQIREENERLAKKLLDMGWSADEIKSIADEAMASVIG